MLSLILIACVLVGATVAVHGACLALLLLALRRWHLTSLTRFWPITRLLLLMTWWLVLFHLAEISVWGLFYWWMGCLPDVEAALYFPESPTRASALAIWCWRSRGGCCPRSRG